MDRKKSDLIRQKRVYGRGKKQLGSGCRRHGEQDSVIARDVHCVTITWKQKLPFLHREGWWVYVFISFPRKVRGNGELKRGVVRRRRRRRRRRRITEEGISDDFAVVCRTLAPQVYTSARVSNPCRATLPQKTWRRLYV